MPITLDQTHIIDALNHYLANSRDPNERECAVSEKGVCHALSVLSCATDNLREKIHCFLSATPEERIRLGSKAWKVGRWLADFVPILQDPANPFANKKFSKQPQTEAYSYASLKVLGRQYTLNVNLNTLTSALKLLTAENCKMVFFFNVHAVSIKFENGLFKIYDPNSPNAESPDLAHTFGKPLDVARYLFTVFSSVNAGHPAEELPADASLNVHLVLVKRESEPEVLPINFINRVKRIDSRSPGKTDLLKVESMSHAIIRGNNYHVGGILPQHFVQAVQKIKDYDYLIQMMPTVKILQVINDPDFKESLVKNSPPKNNVADKSKPHDADLLDLVDTYEDPDHKLIATCLYILIKKNGRTLANIIGDDYKKNKDPLLLEVLKPFEIASIAGEVNDVFAKKLAVQVMMNNFVPILQGENLLAPENLPIAYTNLLALYMMNNVKNARSYMFKYQDDPNFKKHLSDFILIAIDFAIIDNRVDWVPLLLFFAAKYKIEPKSSWLSLAITLERKPIFQELITTLPLANIASSLAILVAAESSGSDMLRSILAIFKANGTLQFYIKQVNADDENPLHVAAYKGKLEHVRILLEYGFNPLAVSTRNETPLYIACALGHVELATLLFINSTTILDTMPDGQNIFNAAKNSGNPKMLETLIALYGDNLNLLLDLTPSIYEEYFLKQEAQAVNLGVAPIPQPVQELQFFLEPPLGFPFDIESEPSGGGPSHAGSVSSQKRFKQFTGKSNFDITDLAGVELMETTTASANQVYTSAEDVGTSMSEFDMCVDVAASQPAHGMLPKPPDQDVQKPNEAFPSRHSAPSSSMIRPS